ncbi:MAG: imidazole glycerol phosphate synthase subunit HisH [Oscillospiraceae bacterium]
MIAIIDYGAGNLSSVKNALDFIGAKSLITSKSEEIKSADAIILPGVGSFGDAMNSMKQSSLIETVKEMAISEKPFLGICLGLQLLFECSEEASEVSGLGVLKGTVKKFPMDMNLKIPHIGWNSLEFSNKSPLYDGIKNDSYVYFVHSYYLEAKDLSQVASHTNYGIDFHSSISDESLNLYATQFHPEKSGDIGLAILRNFVKLQGGKSDVR